MPCPPFRPINRVSRFGQTCRRRSVLALFSDITRNFNERLVDCGGVSLPLCCESIELEDTMDVTKQNTGRSVVLLFDLPDTPKLS